MMIGSIASLSIDAQDVSDVSLGMEGAGLGPAYRRITKELSRVVEAVPSIAYAYIFVKTDKKGIYKFVADVKSPACKGEKATAVPGDLYDASRFPEMLEAFNGPVADKTFATDEWGTFLSSYVPIRDKRGEVIAILGIDMAADDVRDIQRQVRRRAMLVLALGILFSIAVAVVVSGKVTNSVKALIEGVRHIAKGELKYKVKVNGKDEIAELADVFNKMTTDLSAHIKELRRTTAEKERLLKELEIAKDIQQSFLPQSVPGIEGFDIAVATIPARIVGGDFYDFIPIDDHRWGLVVADVSGKGIPAALFMALSRTLIRACAAGKESVADAIEHANRLMLEESKANMFVTIFYAVLDSKNLTLRYVNAGHNPPLLMTNKPPGVTLLEAQGLPLGLPGSARIEEAELRLAKGDLLAIYTDGVTEAVNKKKERFEVMRLLDLMKKYHNLPAEGILKKTRDEVDFFVGDMPQFDDITLMILKVQ
jgi:serine phosphatase RsbU (regulator of sigma subunit)